MSTPERPCPLCGASVAAPRFRKDETDYWLCPACGFGFATPPVNPNLTTAFDDYEDAYLQYLSPNPADDRNLRALCAWMARTSPLEGKRVLDVGAGSGKLVRFLRARGIDAHGIEPSRALFDRFLSGDAAFTCASAEEYVAVNARAFDIVTAFDVIEHLPSPVAFLGTIASTVDPGGAFFASTPDAGSATARAFGRRWHFYYPYHLSYFNRRTAARAAGSQGWELVDCRHLGRVRSVGYIARYAAEFIARRDAPRWAQRFDGWFVPVNLFDTMFLAFRRNGSPARGRADARP